MVAASGGGHAVAFRGALAERHEEEHEHRPPADDEKGSGHAAAPKSSTGSTNTTGSTPRYSPSNFAESSRTGPPRSACRATRYVTPTASANAGNVRPRLIRSNRTSGR